MIGVLLYYTTKNLIQEEIVTYQIQIFFSEILDQLNVVKNIEKEIINEINDSVNSFHVTEKLLNTIKLHEPNVKFLCKFMEELVFILGFS